MNATFNPGQPEVPYVVEVQYKPAIAPTVTLTLSLPDAHLVRALLGHTSRATGTEVFSQLSALLKEHARDGYISFMESGLPAIDPDKARPLR